jgi:hypothetical protein
MICFYNLIGKERIISGQKIQFAYEFVLFNKIRKWSDGVTCGFSFNIDRYKGDHKPCAKIELMLFNIVIFSFEIFNINHVNSYVENIKNIEKIKNKNVKNKNEYTVKVYNDKTEWFLNGERHREDGPAVEFNDGSKYWMQHGKFHRLDGPAIEHKNGNKYWYKKGKRHREDGPAIDEKDNKHWFLNGKRLSEETFNFKTNKNKKTIIMDGRKFYISNESYENFKNSLL